MQIMFPTQKCPAKFVELFQEVLENTDWDRLYHIFICNSIRRHYTNTESNLREKAIVWIEQAIEEQGTLDCWLIEQVLEKELGEVHHVDLYYSNQCRKAWLEWLVSPEGHYTST